ncbi:transposon protein [Hordeum vulgare]|nr:transposon protein [Hordeum vulgare]
MDGLNQLQIKIDAYRASHEVQDQYTTSKPEDTLFEQHTEKVVLSPIHVRSVGRPRSKRKESKIDQVVRKMRAKKQQAGTSTKNVPSQKGRKKGSNKSKNGQDSNLQSSQQFEANTHCEGHEVGGVCFILNEFQELQTTEPATPIHIKSYVDILQGKTDVMDLLASNLNG